MFEIPSKIQYVIDTLYSAGYEAYTVGGCVRDMLMGKTPDDYDIATSASPKAVTELFEHTVPTGIKHGTVTVIIDREPIEVTTYREESGYADNRRPDRVEFVTDLQKDLKRRDFTVNAMAYNPKEGLMDYFGGKEDIENRLLRAVGNPYERFSEDALRILRLFRFASTLGYDIEEQTLEASLKLSGGLESISAERIFTELYKAVRGENFKTISSLITNGGLEFLNITAQPDFDLIRKCRENTDLAFYIFISSGNAKEILEKLKVSNKLKNYCKALSLLKSMPCPSKKEEIKEMLNIAGEEILRDYLKTMDKGEDIGKILDEVIKNNEPYSIKDLKIGGKNIKALGYSGTEIGEALEKARKFVVLHPEYNNTEDLKAFLSPKGTDS